MGLFSKKSNATKNAEDRSLIEKNGKSMEALLILCKNEALGVQLKTLKEEVTYLTPSTLDKVLDCDKKIKELIGDIKIALTKNGGTDTKAEGLVNDLRLKLAERATLM